MFAKGFEEALTRLHTTNNSSSNVLPPPSAALSTTISTSNSLSMSGGTVTYTNLGKDHITSMQEEVN